MNFDRLLVPLRSLAFHLLFALLLAFPAAASDNEKVGAALEQLFVSGNIDTGSEAANARIADLKEFYAGRSFKPVWVRDDGPKAKGRALVAELKRSWVQGLSPAFYNTAEIEALIASTSPDELARLDALMSGAFIDFAGDLANGRIGPQVPGSENRMARIDTNPAAFVEAAAEGGNFLAFASKYLSADDRYVRLIAKLAEYDRIGKAGRWPQIDASAGPIAQGASDPRVPAIRQILVMSGDLVPGEPGSGDGTGDVFDGTLQGAVMSFQERYGLVQDGNLDAGTLAELAVPLSGRIDQMRLNLERRRWQNVELGPNHVYVNLADANVRLVLDGKTVGFFEIENVEELRDMPTFLADATRLGDGGLSIVGSPYLEAIGGQGSGKAIAIAKFDTFADLIAKSATAKPAADGNLSQAIKVYVTYVTAWATSDGRVHFRKDVFGRDPKLAALLYGK
jgi:murein L,D-transpeptidase YcbB/YkuD